jgi:SAM-dependent methyltransferase
MLEAHLNPNWEAATRNYGFVQKSVEWIVEISYPTQCSKLLDLGCGPGIYAELFYEKGYTVTGIDISSRSINFAKENAFQKNIDITYPCHNYLDIDYCNEFDIITLIYCDFGVLNQKERKNLLNKIQRALKPNGLFIFDAWTPKQYENSLETSSWSYSNGGYWSEEPYACFNSFYRYDYCDTFVEQYVIVKKDDVECYNIWNHGFTTKELQSDLNCAGFGRVDFWGNVSGEPYTNNSTTICAIAYK